MKRGEKGSRGEVGRDGKKGSGEREETQFALKLGLWVRKKEVGETH